MNLEEPEHKDIKKSFLERLCADYEKEIEKIVLRLMIFNLEQVKKIEK